MNSEILLEMELMGTALSRKGAAPKIETVIVAGTCLGLKLKYKSEYGARLRSRQSLAEFSWYGIWD